jgi:hypothetical protein
MSNVTSEAAIIWKAVAITSRYRRLLLLQDDLARGISADAAKLAFNPTATACDAGVLCWLYLAL